MYIVLVCTYPNIKKYTKNLYKYLQNFMRWISMKTESSTTVLQLKYFCWKMQFFITHFRSFLGQNLINFARSDQSYTAPWWRINAAQVGLWETTWLFLTTFLPALVWLHSRYLKALASSDSVPLTTMMEAWLHHVLKGVNLAAVHPFHTAVNCQASSRFSITLWTKTSWGRRLLNTRFRP